MKLKNKIYSIQIVFAVVLFSFLTFTYFNYQAQYKKDIKEYINNEVEFRKKALLTSYNSVTRELENKQKLLKSVHAEALKIAKNDIDIDLDELKKMLIKRFDLKDVDLNIFLIDKSYTIYKTTFPKDLGFNLNVVIEAKEFLDKTTRDGKIYVAEHMSIDMMDMQYKLYSYSLLRDDIYLELGFVYQNIQNTLASIIKKDIEAKEKTNLYIVFHSNNKYSYYNMSQPAKASKKNDFYTQNKIEVDAKDRFDNEILSTALTGQDTIIDNEKSVTVLTPFFDEDMYKNIGFSNMILEMEVDISPKLQVLEQFRNIFVISLLVIFIFLLLVFIFIKNSFTKKIDTIVESINNHQRIENKELLSQGDELSIVSKEYNALFDSLNKEIKINENLLLENKRFIADTVHQIRTPLANIMMNGEMVRRFQKDDSLSLFIEQIDASINMLSNSYEDLAYVTSYDTIDYNPSMVHLSDMLHKRILFFETISKVNFKHILSHIEDDIYVYINEVELERVIDNNISNGIKYSHENRPITIALQKIDDVVVLSFKTYGKPIKDRERIFEKNYREDSAKRGLGLGLNMVKIICEKYGIDYSVSYQNGKNIFTYSIQI